MWYAIIKVINFRKNLHNGIIQLWHIWENTVSVQLNSTFNAFSANHIYSDHISKLIYSFLKDLDAMLDLFVEALEQLFVLLPVLLASLL